ncbi:MAG TPA: hypothetical protein VFS05_08660 [Gemmatimonadaceae bacterium]|nr:hypothetical protein [Gemmatimonadaceae bacterium]
MRPLLLAVLLCGTSLAAALPHGDPSSSATRTAEYSCLAPTDSVGRRLSRYLQRLATRQDSAGIALRNSLGIPAVSESQVTEISDTALCARASLAIDSARQVAPRNRPVHLRRYGKFYAVVDPGSHASFTGIWFFDRDFRYLSLLMWSRYDEGYYPPGHDSSDPRTGPRRAGAGACARDTAEARVLARQMRITATGSSFPHPTLRDSLRIPAVPASEVFVVEDSLTCARAAAAYDSVLVAHGGPSVSGREVVVVRVGDRHVVQDPLVTSGEWRVTMTSTARGLSSHTGSSRDHESPLMRRRS